MIMEKSDYHCKDCLFYMNETCKQSGEYRTTTPKNVACVSFEYINIIK